MASWLEDIEAALRELGGIATLSKIYAQVKRIRPEPHPKSFDATIRGTIERNSSDSEAFSGSDKFFSVEGIGSGIWGLRSQIKSTPEASDINDSGNPLPGRAHQKIYRILRDTQLARQLKVLHQNRCQLCGMFIELPDGNRYSEAHHIKPLERVMNFEAVRLS